MARITIHPLVIKTERDWSTGYSYRPEPKSLVHHEADREGAICLPDVKLVKAHLTRYCIGKHDRACHYGTTICYTLAEGEERKFPDRLPDGWTLTRDIGDDGLVWVITLDQDWLQREIVRVRGGQWGEREKMHYVPSLDEIVETAAWMDRAYRGRMMEHLCPTFDIQDEIDVSIMVDRDLLTSANWEAEVRDSEKPWLKPRDMSYATLDNAPEYCQAIPMIYAKWALQNGGDYHREKLDDNLSGASIKAACDAFAVNIGSVDQGREHRYSKRRLGLEDEIALPFPEGFTADYRAGKLLLFKTTRDGRYMRPTDWLSESHVLIHRSNGYHRFLFIEHHLWHVGIAESCNVAFLLPVAVSDAECTRQAPLSPQRGMNPAVTRAIASNPFMASAMQHALNRRKFLLSKIDWSGRVVIPPKATKYSPIIVRDVQGGKRLRGARYTRIGKRTTYDGSYSCTSMVNKLVYDLPENELKFTTEELQPVAAVQPVKTRRRVQLDL